MASLGSLWYQLGIKDMTDADLQKINAKLKKLGEQIELTPKILKSLTQAAVPTGIKIELDPKLKDVSNEALAKAVEGKVMKVEVSPLITHLRKDLKDATKDNPPEIEVGVQTAKFRKLIETVLNRHGFMINIDTVNDNYTKVVQQKLNGTPYKVKIHADAKEITQSVQASLMQVQSRRFGLQITKDVLHKSIDKALMGKKFPISVYVKTENARSAVQTALNKAAGMSSQEILNHNRLMKAEAAAAAAELNRVKAAHIGAADAAKVHASASIDLGGIMGSNIKIAGELGSAMASMYSIHALKEFMSQVVEIGGELEHQKIAMDTIFGDKGKTNELFGQIKGLARQSPFGVMELTKNVKQLSAYGVQYNEIYETSKRLADISAATSVDISRLILAFGKTKSRGFLDGLEAKQFAYANIPIYEMVRKKLEELEGQAVTTADVMARMKKREIGFDIVKDVLWDMTDPGGKFYNMQEALAGSVKTSWKLVRDNIELMFGEVAEGGIGEGLKDVAVILQGLTREWRTLGVTIGATAGAFGIYKVAVALSNRMMGEANALGVQKALTSNKVAAANAIEAQSYRVLTQAEDYAILSKSGLQKLNRSLFLSHRALTEAEWDAVIASKAVNKDYILRRIALGRLTQAEVEYLVSIEAVTRAEAQRAASAANLKISLASLWAMMKQTTAWNWLNSFGTKAKGISMSGIWGGFLSSMQSVPGRFKALTNQLGQSWMSFTNKVRTFTWAGFVTGAKNGFKSVTRSITHAEVGVTQLKLAFAGLGRMMSSIGAFLLNPVTLTMAAIGGLMYAWEKNNEQMEKAKEIGDNIFTKATEGANNLKQVLNDIKPSMGLSDHELTQGIEQMEQAIKDYSPTPIEDINDALVAQDGHVLTLAERYEALKKKVEELNVTYDSMGDMENGDVGTMVSDAIKSTGGFLNDTVIENAKDYTEALKERSDAIREAVKDDSRWIKKIVDKAIEADGEFKKVAKDMTNTAAMFNELASNPEKYQKEYGKVQGSLNALGIGEANKSIKENKATFERDVNAFIEDIAANVRLKWGKEIKDLNDNQKRALAISLKNMLDGAEGVSDEVKMRWAKLLEDALGVTIIEDKIGPALKGAFKTAISSATDAHIIAVVDKWKNEGMDALTFTERTIIRGIMADAKENVMSELGLTQLEMSNHLSQYPLRQTIELVYSEIQTTDLQKEIWNPKLGGLLSSVQMAPSLEAGKLTPKAKRQRNWHQDWTRGSEGYYDTKNKAKSAMEAVYNEILSAENASKEWLESKQQQLEEMQELASEMNLGEIDLKALKSNKHPKGSEKDTLAEGLKQRLDILKKAYSEYKKELAIMSKDEALTSVKEAGIFDELFTGDNAINSFDDYEGALKKLLADAENSLKGLSEKDKNFKGRHELVIALRTLLNLEIPHDKAKEALDNAKNEIDTLVKDYTRKWDFQKQLFELTGNREASVKLAFGQNVPWQTQGQMLESILNTQMAENGLEVPLTISDEEAKEKLKGTALYDLLWKPAKEARQKETIDLELNVAKAVAAAASISEKIQTQIGLRDARETLLRSRKKEDGSDYSETEIAASLKEYDDRIEELKSSMLELLPIWEQIFGDHQYQSYGQIQKASDIAQQIIDNAKIKKDANGKPVSFTSVYTDAEGNEQQITGKISQLEKLRKAINDLYKEGEKKNPFKTLWKALKAVFNGDWKEKSTAEKIALIGQSAADCADLIGDLAGQLSEMFEAIGNESMAQAMTDVQDVMSSVSNIGKGFAEGNVIGGIAAAAGEAIGWATKAFQASARHKEALRAIMNETLAQQREYNLLLMQQNLEYKKATTILGEDTYGKAANAVKVMKNAYETLNKELKDSGIYRKGYKIGVADGMVRRIDTLTTAQRELYNTYAGLANIEIKTGHKKTGLFGWGKGKDIYSSILSVYPELIDANGKFNTSLAETIINTKSMTDESKASFQYMIDLAKQAEAAYEEMNNYMTDIFGDLGSTMTDVLVSAFANGTDAAEAFYDSVSSMLEALAKQMIYSVTLAPLIEDTQNKMMDIMQDLGLSDDQKFEAWAGVLDGMLNDALKQQGVANDLLKKYQDIAAAKGFDIFQPDEGQKSGMTAGLQSLTENTGDLLASYVNAIRADVSVSRMNWDKLLDIALPQMNVIAEAQLQQQRQIAENTLRTAEAAEAINSAMTLVTRNQDRLERSWRRIAEKNWGTY